MPTSALEGCEPRSARKLTTPFLLSNPTEIDIDLGIQSLNSSCALSKFTLAFAMCEHNSIACLVEFIQFTIQFRDTIRYPHIAATVPTGKVAKLFLYAFSQLTCASRNLASQVALCDLARQRFKSIRCSQVSYIFSNSRSLIGLDLTSFGCTRLRGLSALTPRSAGFNQLSVLVFLSSEFHMLGCSWRK